MYINHSVESKGKKKECIRHGINDRGLKTRQWNFRKGETQWAKILSI